MTNFIQELTQGINSNLPGKSAQLKLAPDSRPLDYSEENKIDAAVLLFLYPDTLNNYNLVFMKRTSYNGHHSNQVCFPGGKSEPQDFSLIDTAIRESVEETGIDWNNTEIIGKLTELFIPVSKFLVHPYVAYTKVTPHFKIDPNEVRYLIHIPLNELIDKPVEETKITLQERSFTALYYNINNEVVWGATSMILSEFITILRTLKTKDFHL